MTVVLNPTLFLQLMTPTYHWIYAVAVCLIVAGLWFAVGEESVAYYVRGSSRSASANPLRPNQPVPIDVGKGIENKLDQLLEAIKALNAEALKITYIQGILHGALAATLLLTLILALKGSNK
jgi:hypothetical protein